jgi:ATPase subunit of ABC transporter with duplicated ATPase domains
VLELDRVRPRHTGLEVTLDLRGPERVALTGPNGVGKTSLLRCAMGLDEPAAGSVRLLVPARMLPQGLDLLDPDRSALDNIIEPGVGLADADAGGVVGAGTEPGAGRGAGGRPGRDAGAEAGVGGGTGLDGAGGDRAGGEVRLVRAGLARLGLRGDKASRPVGRLSGGERWRATLAALLLTRPRPQLLVLDEPTNSLDLDARALLVAALVAYPGAFIVVSHDERFLGGIGLDRTVRLGAGAARAHEVG